MLYALLTGYWPGDEPTALPPAPRHKGQVCTPRQVRAGVPALLEIDIEGARQVRRAIPGALLVFLAPPSWEELVRRLTRRGTEPPEVVERRLSAARQELAAAGEFDHTLVNTSVQEVCRQLVTLINSYQ